MSCSPHKECHLPWDLSHLNALPWKQKARSTPKVIIIQSNLKHSFFTGIHNHKTRSGPTRNAISIKNLKKNINRFQLPILARPDELEIPMLTPFPLFPCSSRLSRDNEIESSLSTAKANRFGTNP